jgi:tetratricopeptide (TPR) repeat protein
MMSVVAIALTLVLQAAAPPASTPAVLADFEARLQKDPNNLRLGADYRQTIIAGKQFDRAIKFFREIVRRNPKAQNACINYAFAYVDKIPDASGFSQPFLGRDAINTFSKALQLGPNWLAFYVRGLVYLYYKPFLRVTHLGVEDLERALEMQRREPQRSYHVHTYISLGDGYWKMNNLPRATAVWREGLEHFAGNTALQARLVAKGPDLQRLVSDTLDADIRIDTSLSEF